MLRSLAKASKKAGLLVGILCVAMTLQGCNIAAIMSAAGGLLAGLGQAFGGQTGQVLGQVGQVLGGVGQAFGQQQAGVAGQLAGAVQPGGPLAIPGQTIPGLNPGQTIPGLNPGQTIPGLNPGQTIPGINPQQTGQLQLPGLQDSYNRTIAALRAAGQPLSLQLIQQLAAQNSTDPNVANQVTQAIVQQLQQQQGVATPPFIANGQGAPAGIPLQLPQGGNNLFNAAQTFTTGILGIINGVRSNGNTTPVQPTPVQPAILTIPAGTPPGNQILTA